MSDCLWGLLDGMNDAGLAVSLTFGGRRVLGDGFGIPLVVRYLLETCDDVAEAREALARLPYALAHNLTLVDRAGDVLTAYLSPDREPFFRTFPAATNHQGMVEWPEQARATRTIERERCILDLLGRSRHDGRIVRGRVPAVPTLQHGVRQRFGTLYTAVYRPADGTVDYRWPASRGGSGSTRSRRPSTPRCWPRGPLARSPERSFPDGRASSWSGGTLRRDRRGGTTMENAESRAPSTPMILGIVGGVALAIGSFLNWATVSVDFDKIATAIGIDPADVPPDVRAQGTVSVTGWKGGDGKWTLVAGVVVVVAAVLLSMASSRRVVGIVMLIGGVVGGGLALYDATIQKNDAVDNAASTFAGIGLPGGSGTISPSRSASASTSASWEGSWPSWPASWRWRASNRPS